MAMTPRLRKVALTAHVVSAVGWIGALASFLALSVAGLVGPDAETVRAAYIACGLVTRFVIVPLAVATLLTGLVQALGTPWGLFRHYWVAFKLLIVVTASFMLMLKTDPIDYMADAASQTTLSGGDLRDLRLSLAGHAAGGLAMLLWAAALAVFKPRGVTWWNARKKKSPSARS